MLIPVRCQTCLKVTGNKWESYNKMIKPVEKGGLGLSPEKALDALGLIRICCRRTVMCHVELIDDLLLYKSIEETFPNLSIDDSKEGIGKKLASKREESKG